MSIIIFVARPLFETREPSEKPMPVMKEADVRAKIRELIMELRDVNLLNEDEKIDPPISDLTKMWIEDPQRYKSTVRDAIKRAMGHLPIAAKELDVSERTLRRHIRQNFADGELDDILASPGPDPNMNVKTGKKRSDKEKAARQKSKKRSGWDKKG
jgi:hypothetical protein